MERVKLDGEQYFVEVEDRGGVVKTYEILPPSVPTFRKIMNLEDAFGKAKTAKQIDMLLGDVESCVKETFPEHREILKLPMQYTIKLLVTAISAMQGEKKTPDAGKTRSRSRRKASLSPT